MTRRLSIEEVVDQLRELQADREAMCKARPDVAFHSGSAHAFRQAADLAADAIPRWQDVPTSDGWYWCEELEADAPPQLVQLVLRTIHANTLEVIPKWLRWTVSGWVPLEGRVCPIGRRPE